MSSCQKRFIDIPFAHRQSAHDGHCAFIHGHNWTFVFDIQGDPDPATGFIVDFGGETMKFIKKDLDEFFDHACILNVSDADGRKMVEEFPSFFKARYIPSCSSEGIAEFLFRKYERLITSSTQGRARLSSVTVIEDHKNSACCHG